MTSVSALYAQRLESGGVSPDPAQAAVVARLDRLAAALTRPRGVRLRLGPSPERIRGLYIWGAVGRGKSMLMDLFFESLEGRAKMRRHFHDFMIETHAFIHDWRQLSSAERRRHPAFVRDAGEDPIAPAAKRIADAAGVLCFDELQVTSIADAMILGRLFEKLFERGVVVVATSNRAPEDLYRNGINRQLFEPFIRRIREELDVVELTAARDYRLERLTAMPVWGSPLGPEARALMDDAFRRLTAGATTASAVIETQGRQLVVPCEAAGCARFSFAELCDRPLGAADYLALARRYHTLFIDDIPRLGPQNRNEAARFVTLIDALYEAKTKLVASAADEPDGLYPAGDGSFEFARTASRLHEMRSDGYLAAERGASG
jgi:cell division protein ZapE